MVLIRRDEGYWRKYVAAARAGLSAGAALILCAASSNPPAPGGGIGNQPPKPPSESHADAPKQNQQGTQQNPFIVQVINTKENYPESTKASQENSDEAANWWLVRLTFGLIVVGLIQAGVFWVQANRLKETITKMDEIARGQTSDMKDSIAQAKLTACAMADAAVAMDKQAKLAQQSYLATHRPRLKVRYIVSGDLAEASQVTAAITVTNVGYTNCRIVEIDANIFIRADKVEANKPLWSSVSQDLPPNPLILPSQPLYFTVFGDRLLDKTQIEAIQNSASHLCLAGMMVYEDDNGTKRTTSFFRIYDPKLRRFVRPTEADIYADYEYED